ncbi:hypothetical protein [Piscinibacter koreensis]|uniref:Uncharacterized protein n=1 Tax=Piscinibacter koreensis TaxID=2742824 RepID=A0A7Y6NTN8_9BURK|nr:hypothetical protein [Schlegelella koreensis]NUZ09135.1 hypothetical protein [Schlegelella koreensis]
MIVPADGGVCASVAVVGPERGGLRSQRFIDLGQFQDAESAFSAAIGAAEAWIDDEARRTRRTPGTDFASLF